ncbi:unnamed protein product [Tuber aestivum]|uniref:BTB domain-containing protein n=1 Tax=Tuber aestivum TaxID=59557 RepID=A0A292PYI1_9PEZI|nr:unnamed protein product [Tuber aestivum]
MSKNPATILSSKYKIFMFDGIVTLYLGPDRKKMEIHKKLLASVSLELDKHVNNCMKEGIEGIIYFPDEGEFALSLFAEWAYTGEYTIMDNTPLVRIPDQYGNYSEVKADPWPSLRTHLELYTFSDKFNIPTLKLLAKSKFSTEISPVDLKGKADADGLTSLVEYAYNNLPDSDPIQKFLAQFAAWKLELLQERDEFVQFISTQPEFMKELLVNLKGLANRPALA